MRHFSLLLALLATGCASFPDRQHLVTDSVRTLSPEQCYVATEEDDAHHAAVPLDGEGFVITSWNIFKQQKGGWDQALSTLSDHSDLLLLQEAYLNPGLVAWLESRGLFWSQNPGFYTDHPAGVMNLSRSPAERECGHSIAEPWIKVPKTALLSYYPLKGSKERLLVVNVHGVNFTLTANALGQQLQDIQHQVRSHRGPVVLAGDFNTWSDSRQQLLERITSELELQRVAFAGQQPAKHFGKILDHIYVRGLDALHSEIQPVAVSDHYPLTVKLALSQLADES
ncbi:MAG: endonuclease/exonuclease/phosphatase family protein [bacterium]